MIDWNKYFDHIVIVSASKYKERRERLDKEFDRIGLTNYEYFYNIMDNLLSERMYEYNINRKCCIHAHYFVIKRAYELGWDSIWIMEDDVRFLKDESRMQNILDEFVIKKDTSNVYMFDYIFWRYDNEDKQYADYFGAASYWLDRKGMEYFIYVIEHWPIINDSWFMFGLARNSSVYCHYNYYVDTGEDERKYYDIELNIPENTVLPCYMDKSSERLCIQYEDNHVSKYYIPQCEENYINESLYNFE